MSSGYTFLDDAYGISSNVDVPAQQQMVPTQRQAAVAMGSSSAMMQQQMVPTQRYGATPPNMVVTDPRASPAYSESQGNTNSNGTVSVASMIEQLAGFMVQKENENRESREHIYSMISDSQIQTQQHSEKCYKQYASSLEILLFVVIGLLVLSLFAQMLVGKNLSDIVNVIKKPNKYAATESVQ